MAVLKYPLATEKAVGLITKGNTIVYVVDSRATKAQIKQEFQGVFNTKVSDVRTVNMPNNVKRAYIKLSKESSAGDIAMKLKLV
ncbi:MAG: 50S ribosomal protein L23 [Methanothrix sp.]